MNKTRILICLFLFGAALLSASGIAVVSANEGKNTVRRDKNNIKFATGAILENNDELETGKKSGLGFRFIDGEASLRIFSSSKLKLSSFLGLTGFDKRAELLEGSLWVQHQAVDGTLMVLCGKSRLACTNASFLLKKTRSGKAILTVFEGSVRVVKQNGSEKNVEPKRTAEITSNGSVTVRPTKDSDLSAEELAAIQPAPDLNQRNLTVPMADAEGRIKYVELVW